MNKPMDLRPKTYPMRSTAVNFTNGMIVTDTDLTAAMQYPVQLMQMVNRGVYGCGVVCGFDFTPDPAFCGKPQPCDPCDENESGLAFGFKLQVGRGTAIDCFGMPIELCEPVLVDVEPERCGCSSGDDVVCIAIRRVSATESPRGDCCGETPPECARIRDHVELRAFPADKLPDHICAYDHDDGGQGCGCGGEIAERDPYKTARDDDDQLRDICKCLIQCDPCECCGDGWVLLGCVTLCKSGVEASNFQRKDEKSRTWQAKLEVFSRRRYIKTIECLCGSVRRKKNEPDGEEEKKKFQEELRAVGITTERNLAVARAMNITSLRALESFMTARRKDALLAFGYKDDKFDQVIAGINKKLSPDTGDDAKENPESNPSDVSKKGG